MLRRWCPVITALALIVPATALADPKDDARRHFAAGLKAAQEGDFEIALQRFLAAQEAYPHPATLYNIAQSYMDLGDLPNALTYFRLSRDAAPDGGEKIDEMIQVIEARMGAPTDTPTGPGAGGAVAAGSGPVRVVATGPTEEEIARLESLATEIEALMAAIRDRRDADIAAAQAAATATEAGDGTPAVDVPVDEIPDIPTGAGFLEGAYEKIVVTASRVGQDPLDSPSTLTVLTGDDVRMMGAQNIGDVLRRVVGVEVMELSSGHADVSIRGFQRKIANKVLILVDGRSTYTDFAGITFLNGLQISMEEIDRIEVIRGPGSAVYGANAVTGVVNIITKTPGEIDQRLVHVDVGMPGLLRGTVYASGRAGDTAYRLSAGYQEHGRWAKELDLEGPNGNLRDDLAVDPFFEDQDTGMALARANGRIDRVFGAKGFASLSAGMTTGRIELYNLGALPNFGVEILQHYVRGDLAWGSLHLRTFWNSDTGFTGPWLEQVGQARTLDSPFDNDAVDVELEGPLEFETGPVKHTLNLGVGYRYKRIEFDNYLDDEVFVEHHGATFLNEQIAVGKLGAVASMRVDYHPLLPLTQTISPRGAVLYRLFDKTSLRATAGTAFRAPNALESYMDFNLNNPAADGVFIRDLGDSTTLLPERITTFELGVHDESTYKHTADVVVYMNRVTKLIDLSPVDPGVNPFNPDANGFEAGTTGWVNLDDVYTGTGVEAEVELYPTDGLDVHTNVDVQQMVRDDGVQAVKDKSTAAIKLNAGTMYRTPWRIDLTFDLHYVGAETWSLRGFDETGQIQFTDVALPARVLTSARVAARPFADERLEIAGTAWNIGELFGDGFQEHPDGQPITGRLFGSVRYTF